MSENIPVDEQQIAKDRAYFTNSHGGRLTIRHIMDGKQLRAGLRALALLASHRQPDTLEEEMPDRRTWSFAGGLHTFPPHYFRVRLYPNFRVLSNERNTELVRRVADAGDYSGKIVAAHNIALGADPVNPMLYVATLGTDARTTAPVVLGLPLEMARANITLNSVKHGIPPDLVVPTELVGRPTGAPGNTNA